MLGGVIGFLFRWQYWLIAGAVAAFVGGAYAKGRWDGCLSGENKKLVEMIETKERLNEILVDSVTGADVAKLMRRRAF